MGTHFTFEDAGVKPDLLCLSKAVRDGLPMSILIFDKEIDTWLPGEHTGTFRGNQLAMVSGVKAMEIIRRDNFANKAKMTGNYIRHGLQKIATCISCIVDVRGKGLMLGIEIYNPEDGSNKFGEPLATSELIIGLQCAALEYGLTIEKDGHEGSVLCFPPPDDYFFE
ncbi:aminotransferase class III-fold pyridoxal phosphate-dependent enzyme [Candidatus Enterovibrio altilux]|uniref:aminotransferase class III-fold pyridoxal phosphate-dependent enzyme n=1 Tax=Candidatus Enterovibrio altilux TaxID=1927128 RepID=UPI0021DFE8CB|nr:aminotransferase class III-fold pyridoxal phosphate-dependent enzyme [Candidatus Enterovibrio luxaltus]